MQLLSMSYFFRGNDNEVDDNLIRVAVALMFLNTEDSLMAVRKVVIQHLVSSAVLKGQLHCETRLVGVNAQIGRISCVQPQVSIVYSFVQISDNVL